MLPFLTAFDRSNVQALSRSLTKDPRQKPVFKYGITLNIAPCLDPMHIIYHTLFSLLIAPSRALPGEKRNPSWDTSTAYTLIEAGSNTTILDYYILAQQSLCSPGATECVGHCCVGNSCCSHGAVPCCLAGSVDSVAYLVMMSQ